VRLAVGILEDISHKIGYQLPIGRATIDKYTEDIAVSSERVQTELGFRPQYDLQSGWRETVQQMRRVGNL
jgi:nucleoside-diphosphate-sugar epimerase